MFDKLNHSLSFICLTLSLNLIFLPGWVMLSSFVNLVKSQWFVQLSVSLLPQVLVNSLWLRERSLQVSGTHRIWFRSLLLIWHQMCENALSRFKLLLHMLEWCAPNAKLHLSVHLRGVVRTWAVKVLLFKLSMSISNQLLESGGFLENWRRLRLIKMRHFIGWKSVSNSVFRLGHDWFKLWMQKLCIFTFLKFRLLILHMAGSFVPWLIQLS